MPEFRRRFIACGVPRDYFYRRIRSKIVFQCEEREADSLLGRLHWIARKEMRPNLNARDIRIFRDPVDYTFRPSLIDVMLPGKHFQSRRVDVESELLRQIGPVSPEKIAERIVGYTDV